MKRIFENKPLYSLVIATFFCVFVLPVNESLWFAVEALSGRELTYSYILKFFFGITLWLTVWFSLFFAENITQRNSLYTSWAKVSLPYGCFLGILFALIFPGYWAWDEFFVLSQSNAYQIHSWQHIFTQIQYVFSLYLLPSSTGIVLVQLTAISLIVGYILAKIKSYLPEGSRLWLIALIPFLLPPTLLSNFYTLRLHIYGYILLLFLFKIFVLYKEKKPSNPQYLQFLFFVFLTTLLAFWRTEGIVYLLTLPLIGYRLAVFTIKSPSSRFKLGLTILAAFAILVSGYLPTKLTEEPHYKLTATINPLSMMIHEELRGENIEAAWNDVGTVLELEVLRNYPSYIETPSIWRSNGHSVLRENYSNHLGEYYRGVSYIFLNNPDVFLKYRLKTFLATNAMDGVHSGSYAGWLTPYSISGCRNMDPAYCNKLDEFAKMSRLNGVIDPELRKNTINALLLQGNERSPLQNLFRSAIWNITPTLILLSLTWIHSLLSRRYIWTIFATLLLTHAGLVFLTAPANYFMYYFPIYLAGGAIATLYLILNISKQVSVRKEQPSTGIIRDVNVSNHPKILVAIPAYNCEKHIADVLAGFDSKLLERLYKVIVIDDRGTDNTASAAAQASKKYKLPANKVSIVVNDRNLGLGGSHKMAFLYGEKLGADYVAILHGDNQAKTSELNNLIDIAEQNPSLGAILGCRFMKGSVLKGYDWKRIWGNRVINVAYSVVALRMSLDLGSGLNLFRLSDLKDHRYLGFDDRMTFNIDLLLDYYSKKTPLKFVPITWSEDGQVTNARNWNVAKKAFTQLVLWRFGRLPVNKKPAANYTSSPYKGSSRSK